MKLRILVLLAQLADWIDMVPPLDQLVTRPVGSTRNGSQATPFQGTELRGERLRFEDSVDGCEISSPDGAEHGEVQGVPPVIDPAPWVTDVPLDALG
eukprot:92696-Karenia_brevis.AAC.1